MKHLVKKTVIMALFAIAMTNFIACSGDDDEPTTVSVTGVSLDQATLTKKVGETFVLKAMVQPEDATNKEVTWKSSDKTVAKVDTNGEVVALKEGQADITVTTKDGNKTAVCKVKVAPKVPLESIEVAEKYYVGIKEEKFVKVVKIPAGATEELQWEVADPNVATIDSTGKIIGKEAGETTLTVKTADGRITKTCTMMVQPVVRFATAKNDLAYAFYLTCADENKDDVWIDLNGNGTRDANESIPDEYGSDNGFSFVKTAKSIAIYGKITRFESWGNELESIDISGNKGLTELACGREKFLKNIDISENLDLESIYYNGVSLLESVDVSKHKKLQHFEIKGTPLITSLDISNNTELKYFRCIGNKLTSLDVSNNTKLESLYCAGNQLTSLDISKNTELIILSCNKNKLTSLDVSNNTKLEYLYCNENQLTSLDVSKNTELKGFRCHKNQLTNLDVSKNTKLDLLYCNENQLTNLDLSANAELKELNCSNNQLTSLDVSMCPKLGEDPYELFCTNNPNLTCIKVSAAQKANIPNTWHKDDTANYNTTCD